MLPPIALRRPDEFLAVVQLIPHFLSGIARVGNQRPVIDEGLALFGYQATRFARIRGYFDDAVDLMPALVVLERDRPAVLAPEDRLQVVGVGKERVVDRFYDPVSRFLRVFTG